MSIVTETYTRKPFEIEAIRVTSENMADVTLWCGGTLELTPAGKQYIKVDVTRPLNEKQTRAFPGDWLLQVRGSFKVYTHKAFNLQFDKGTIKTNNQLPLFELQSDGVTAKPVPKIHTLPQGYPEPSTR